MRKRVLLLPNNILCPIDIVCFIPPAKFTPDASAFPLTMTAGPVFPTEGPHDYSATHTDAGVSPVDCGGGMYKYEGE